MDLSVGIIGYGKLGSAIARELSNNNLLNWIVGRNKDNFNLSSKIHFFDNINKIVFFPDITLLTVQDSKLELLVNDLANSNLNFDNKIIAHCSGFLRKDILELLRNRNALIASIHPFQTFYFAENTNFDGIWYGVDCDESAKSKINHLIKILKGNALFFDNENIKYKEFYHLSAVAISNFLTPILQLGKDFAEISGINPVDFFLPIINQTIQNNLLSKNIDTFPLTGTISRGDTNAYLIHLQKLNNYSEQKIIFKHLSLATIHSAYFHKIIPAETYQNFLKITDEN